MHRYPAAGPRCANVTDLVEHPARPLVSLECIMNDLENTRPAKNFIEQAIDADLESGHYQGVFTRFPPEPNGYLHIGHAKSICLNFGLARNKTAPATYGSTIPIRQKKRTEYVESIMEDVRWLGFQWDGLFYASDYFEQLYQWAEQLIQHGHAYVCDLTGDEMRAYRGTLTEPGKNSPYRDRSVEENLKLFRAMRAGEFPDGSRTLRAKIDMASNNINLRDTVLYRILRAHHHRTGDAWCIYPMYDWAHGQSDSIEKHLVLDLHARIRKPSTAVQWFCDTLGIHRPRQMEFARLNINSW